MRHINHVFDALPRPATTAEPSVGSTCNRTRAVTNTERGLRGASPHRDQGNSIVEIVISVALMGITVVAVLSGIQVVVSASLTDRDQAQAFEWLQAASDSIYSADREPCTSDGTGRLAAIAVYDAAAQLASVPPAWDGTDAALEVTNVEYLGRLTVDSDFEWGETFCFEGTGFVESPLYTQRVTISVTSPDSSITQTLEMVKSER